MSDAAGALPHLLTVLHQIRQRADSDGWMDTERTGLALAVCNCGLTTGWIPRAQLLDQVDASAHASVRPDASERSARI